MSRWGNFLQGIESGLDKILAEDGSENQQFNTQTKSNKSQITNQTRVTRQDSTGKKSERLQERLAKAVDGSSPSSPQNRNALKKPVDGHTIKWTAQENGVFPNIADQIHDPIREEEDGDLQEEESGYATKSGADPDRRSKEFIDSNMEVPSTVAIPFGDPIAAQDKTSPDELNESYLLERIEELQAKLDIFVKDAASRARADQERNDEDSHVRTAAKQEEKIASLMAEGQNLSRKELKHLGTIRRLHLRLGEMESTLAHERKLASEAQRDVQISKLKIQSLEDAQRSGNPLDKGSTLPKSQIERTQEQIGSYTTEVARLRRELDRAQSNDLQAEFDMLKQKSDTDQHTISDLKDELDSRKIEKDLTFGRHKLQLEELRDEAERERNKVNLREAEWESEIKALETKLEAMRSRNEETVGNPIDAQAKQLRQIEALQRQHSVSKENWNGIEASLNARISSLERERDDLLRKETESRKKVRDTVLSLRKKDEELEQANESFLLSEKKLQSEQATVKALQSALDKARLEHALEVEQLSVAQEISTEKAEAPIDRISSDSLDIYGSVDASTLLPNFKQTKGAVLEAKDRKKAMAPGISPSWINKQERLSPSRKSSAVSPYFYSDASHGYQHHQSTTSITRSSSRSAFRDSQSVCSEGKNDENEGLSTPVTPGRGFGNVLTASTSTPAAGPSVQLVERMSSAVRRLESEKASTRDELERMSNERDEARKQIVSLLEEVEAKRNLQRRISELEDQVQQTAQRYQTTLELLGEKSETVEELKADIADMKQIYRETLEKSMSRS